MLSFFFQAEDGIRDLYVTGVQTCALPICDRAARGAPPRPWLSGPSRGRCRVADGRGAAAASLPTFDACAVGSASPTGTATGAAGRSRPSGTSRAQGLGGAPGQEQRLGRVGSRRAPALAAGGRDPERVQLRP